MLTRLIFLCWVTFNFIGCKGWICLTACSLKQPAKIWILYICMYSYIRVMYVNAWLHSYTLYGYSISYKLMLSTYVSTMYVRICVLSIMGTVEHL